jgi:hypothetical protein
MDFSPQLLTTNAINWHLGSQGIPFDSSKITVDATGKVTKWAETAIVEPTESQLDSIKTTYQKAYTAAITDFGGYSDFYDNMIAKINGIPNCAELESYAEKLVTGYFTTKISDLTQKISSLASLGGNGSLSLSSLGSVIGWITKFVSSNLVGPYAKATALLAITITKQAEVVAAVANKVSELECDI